MLAETATRRRLIFLVCVGLCLSWGALMGIEPLIRTTLAQEAVSEEPAGPTTGSTNDEAGFSSSVPVPAPVVRVNEEEGVKFFSLLVQGGWFMVPIGMLSIVAVTIVIERTLALRRSRVLPNPLVKELGRLAGTQGTFDPREAYRLCQRYPSAAANVVRAMLLKVGRPHSEVEHTVQEVSEREAERLYSNVRWLNLTAGVAPLLGLLGTVWGMIVAFHRTTLLGPGQNKAEELAAGIYIALVTTLGGLMVAIPAAVFSHLFEGRIQTLFHQIDELLFNLLPQIERFEGRMRFGQQAGDGQRPMPADPPQVASPQRHGS